MACVLQIVSDIEQHFTETTKSINCNNMLENIVSRKPSYLADAHASSSKKHIDMIAIIVQLYI